jgi:hypothetical protein
LIIGFRRVDVQLYNEKAFQNNIKSIYMYPAHIYTTQYKETKLHQSSRNKFGAPDVRSDVGDDSDDGDFEPSLNFTLRFVMLISYVSVVTYILEILS